MTRYASGPVSARRRDETATRPPRSTAGIVPFVLLPFAVVLAASLPVTAAAVVAGAALAELRRRARTVRDGDEKAPMGPAQWGTYGT